MHQHLQDNDLNIRDKLFAISQAMVHTLANSEEDPVLKVEDRSDVISIARCVEILTHNIDITSPPLDALELCILQHCLQGMAISNSRGDKVKDLLFILQ
jgi:hypothetical protein